MTLLDSYLSLIEAEQDYAVFNAHRTCSGQSDADAIGRTVHRSFSCILDPSRPENAYYNRAVLLPSTEAVTRPQFSDLPSSVRGVEILIAQQTEATSKALIDAGFFPGPSLCYLATEPEKARPLNHCVKRFDSDQTGEFFDLLELGGAEFPEAKRQMKKDFYCSEQFRCHVSYTETGDPTGWATSFLCGDDESAFLANAFTLPEFRRQGFHAALIQARLNELITLGRKRAYTDVVAGSQSHSNTERLGFRIVTNNHIWIRK